MDIECPYCGEDFEINHDDGFGCEEDELHQVDCPHCEKVFVFTTSIIYNYHTQKADCLNSGQHKFRLIKKYPKQFSFMRCTMCESERELTDAEKKHHNIN